MPRKSYNYAGTYHLGRNVSVHIAVAEKAFGGRLPEGSIVHHVDEDTTNNSPSNLVVCPDEAYHNLLHKRGRAYDACGNANYEHCQYCGEWDDPANLIKTQKNDRPSVTYYHGNCRNQYRKNLYNRRKGKSNVAQS